MTAKSRRPRRDVILRRFERGESISTILTAYWSSDLGRLDVEDVIRAALNRKPRSKR